MGQSTSAVTKSGETVHIRWTKHIRFDLVAGRRRYGATGAVGTQGLRAETAYSIIPTPDGVSCRVRDEDGHWVDQRDFPTLVDAQEWATLVESHHHETGRWPDGKVL